MKKRRGSETAISHRDDVGCWQTRCDRQEDGTYCVQAERRDGWYIEARASDEIRAKSLARAVMSMMDLDASRVVPN